MTIRAQVIQYLVAMLKQIRTAKGYNTDLGESIYVWRPVTANISSLPILNIKDTSCDFSRDGYGFYTHSVSFEVEALIDIGEQPSEEMLAVHEDIYKALWNSGELSLGGIALNLVLNNSSCDFLQEAERVSSVVFSFTVTFRTKAESEAAQ